MTDVALIGCGAIGGAVAHALAMGEVADARHVGTIHRHGATTTDGTMAPAEEIIGAANIVVEAAGPDAVHQWGPQIIAAGRDLLVVSVGALAIDGTSERLQRAGHGHLLVSSGAIGGLDIIGAAARAGSIRSVKLTTVKPARTLGIDTDHVTVVFSGTARDAVRAYPRGLNVAASIALACGSWDAVAVRLLADPGATSNSHTVEVDGDVGTYRIEAHNRPSPTTPTTSAVTVGAVLHAIGERTHAWTFA